jgi:membrane protease YdiL (CAAX protease family)
MASLVLLLVIFIAVPYLGARTHRSGQALLLQRLSVYFSMVITHWLLAGLLVIVLWLEGQTLESIGLRPVRDPRGEIDVAGTLGLTVALLLGASLIILAMWALRRALNKKESDAVRHFIPRTARERIVLGLVVAPTAGIVEELLYRGFAISRLAPLIGGPWPAAVLTAGGFSLGHVYQGPLGVLRAFLLGLLLAVPYVTTGSLLPSILAHFLIDLSTIFFGRAFLDEPDDGIVRPPGP